MEKIEYANAYSEVIEILKNVSIEDYNKIPVEKINLFKTHANKDYRFQYNPLLTLDEQNVSKRAKAIIAILFRDYWATDEQRRKILAKQNYDKIQIEKNKQQKYNSNNIFMTKTNSSQIENECQSLIKYKESFFIRILNKLKNIFRK